jgi:hypothetical protein
MPKQPTLAIRATHGVVYRNDNEFNSHPFLGGFWRTRDGSLLLAFMSAECNYENASDVHHDNITTRRRRMRTIRSFDNGVSWDASTLDTVFETPEQGGDDAAAAEQAPLPDEDDADVLIATGSSPAILVPDAKTWMRISTDGGRTNRFLSRVNDWGAPGDIVEMADGRIVCVYGYRLAPQGIRYRVSADGGKSWGDEVILRTDGGSWDLGYPRVIEHSPGRLLAVYYFNSAAGKVQFNGGVRHIASTEFTP